MTQDPSPHHKEANLLANASKPEGALHCYTDAPFSRSQVSELHCPSAELDVAVQASPHVDGAGLYCQVDQLLRGKYVTV